MTLFQSAVDAVEHGLSLWLPQLRNSNKLSTSSAEDSVEVCMILRVCVCMYVALCQCHCLS